ncbi:PilZ domain-containing protein [Piscirickettsia salmonis]|uniref:PilZ domain-containing protein n=1 Tax=Piscirickettsia salmonis TaxID=1238 RepID=UPI0007D86DF0|nr:hypothetical protein A0O36_00480 [Piscirickettsiaceae bacterium NZ-RLO1]
MDTTDKIGKATHMVEYEEKREYIRLDAQAKLRFTLPNREELYQGICQNLSGGGILFETNIDIPVGSLIDVALEPNGNYIPPLEAQVKVNRSFQESDTLFIIAGGIQAIA